MKRATEFRLRQILVILFSAFLAGVTPAGIAVSGDLAVAEGPAASGQAAEARQDDALLETTIKLEDLLGEDGTLDLDAAGNRGSIDGRGYQVASGHGEAPRIETASVPGDERWVAFQVGITNADGSSVRVNATAVDGSGNLYAGGKFDLAGGGSANNIAEWDGRGWSALGRGTNGTVYALAVDRAENLYVGGVFTQAGLVAANRIAKRHGNTWSALGSGISDGTVYALAVDGSGNLYAGGSFIEAGGVTVNRIARWDGSTWSALGSGISDGIVHALAVDGSGNLYAGGSFTGAGGASANNIAMWNGNSWSALGSGVNGSNATVSALAADGNGNVYATGHFQQAGAVPATNVAKWNGSTWSTLGSGLRSQANPYSASGNALAVDGSGNLYAGGGFNRAGGVVVNNIAKWDGSVWSALGNGISIAGVNALAVDGSGNLYAGGSIERVNNIAKWNGSSWSALGASGTSDTVLSLVVDGSTTLYVGGRFGVPGTAHSKYIAKWNGSSWSALGIGINGGVYALAVDWRGNIYAGGLFTKAGYATANGIAQWDGKKWSRLGSGIDIGSPAVVNALAVDGSGNLYVGGSFTQAGVIDAKFIAKWDGTSWSALGSGMNGFVYALAVDGSGNLYAGGEFTQAGGIDAFGIAKWDGSAWSALGSGMFGSATDIAVDRSGNLYASGVFRFDLQADAHRVVRWDGSTWSTLGSEIIKKPVNALALDGSGNLYVGGDYVFKRWNGSAWSDLGSAPTGGPVRALASDGSGNIYVGGEFVEVGGMSSAHIAMWQGRPALAVDSTSRGLTLYRNGVWEQIQAASPDLMAPFGSKLVASIPGLGLQAYDGAAWSLLSARTDAERVIGIGTDLFVDFGSDGLYRYRNGWTRITRLNTQKLAAYGESLAFSVPGTLPQSGIYLYDGSTTKRISTKGSPQQMLGIQKKLYVDFGPSGLSCYDGTWKVLNAANPSLMTAAGTRLVASFPGSGISVYDGNKWNLISSDANAENIVATPFVIYVDRGPDGIYKYKKGWQKISSDNPDKMRLYAGKLVATFPGKGLYLFDEAQWTRLSTADDIESMLGLIFE